MSDYIKRGDVVNLGVMMQTHLWTREQTYNAIFCLPSADVAPVVRCKDCFLYGECQAAKFYGDDGYCSVGERKNDDIR